jgi:hypothetical protein
MVLGRWRRGSDGLPGGRGIPGAPEDPTGRPRRQRRAELPAPPELTEIAVGFDRFAAGALVARLEAEGIAVRLLTMDEHGLNPGLAARHPHRLLIRADDEDRVLDIVRRTT